jgi:hypothetical protein
MKKTMKVQKFQWIPYRSLQGDDVQANSGPSLNLSLSYLHLGMQGNNRLK